MGDVLTDLQSRAAAAPKGAGQDSHAFLGGGLEMGERIAAFDWASTPLGPLAFWPASLRSFVNLMLAARQPMFIAWGPERTWLYNDSFMPILGAKHPQALGRPALTEVWAEAVETLEPLFAKVFAGEAVQMDDISLELDRWGRLEEARFSFTYTPLQGQDGAVAGLFGVCSETTALFHSENLKRRADAQLQLTAAEASALAERVALALDAGAIVGTWVWNVPDNMVLADEQFAKSFGLGREACRTGLPIETVMESIHPDDRARVAESVAEALGRGGAYRCEYRVLRRDGVYRWTEASGRVEMDAEGRAGRFPGVLVDIQERRDADLALGRANELLRGFMEAVPGVLYAKDLDGRLTLGNGGVARLLGAPEGGFVGHTDMELLANKAEAAKVMANDRRIMESGVSETLDEEVTYPDGTRTIWRSVKSPLRDEAGNVIGLVGASIDITAERIATDQLHDREERLRAALAGSGAGTFRWDILTNELDWDVELDRIFGLPPGQTARDLPSFLARVHPDDREGVIAACRRCAETGADFEMTFRVVWPDGRVRWIFDRGSVYRDHQGRPAYMAGACLDVSDRYEATAKLEASEARLRLAQEAGQIGTFEWDPDTDEMVLSDQYCALFGLPPLASVKGVDILRMVEDEDRGLSSPARLAASQTPLPSIEFRIRRRDTGEQRWMARRGKMVAGPGGVGRRMSGVVYDVTERHESERHRELLVNELNHRVKNTLAIVQATAHQSLRRSEVPVEVRDGFMARIGALAAAHDILTRRNWESVSLNELLQATLAPFNQSERIAMQGPDLLLQSKTAVSFSLAMHELATNAAKYGALSVEGGEVSVVWLVTRQDDDVRLKLKWRETGGPEVRPPPRRGFGSRMIETALASELGGTVKLDFDRLGLVCAIDAPIEYPRVDKPLPIPGAQALGT